MDLVSMERTIMRPPAEALTSASGMHASERCCTYKYLETGMIVRVIRIVECRLSCRYPVQTATVSYSSLTTERDIRTIRDRECRYTESPSFLLLSALSVPTLWQRAECGLGGASNYATAAHALISQ